MSDDSARNSASLLLDLHGDEAFYVAREKADQAYARGNSEGEREWTRVLTLLSDLSAKRRVARSSIH